jgi:hypothetical protein
LDALDEAMAAHFWAMETAGFFQMRFLQALEGRGGITGDQMV